MTPIRIGDCGCPGTVSAASATRTRATSTIGRLPIEGLLRDPICGSENSARFHSREASVSSRAGRAMGAKFFGAAVKRREDPRFLLGEGRFVDDVTVPGMLHASFLRSPHAHAHIVKIDTTAASASPGVVRVLTFKDLERWMKPLPLFGAVPPGLGAVV